MRSSAKPLSHVRFHVQLQLHVCLHGAIAATIASCKHRVLNDSRLQEAVQSRQGVSIARPTCYVALHAALCVTDWLLVVTAASWRASRHQSTALLLPCFTLRTMTLRSNVTRDRAQKFAGPSDVDHVQCHRLIPWHWRTVECTGYLFRTFWFTAKWPLFS